jgi:hypothetical protein
MHTFELFSLSEGINVNPSLPFPSLPFSLFHLPLHTLPIQYKGGMINVNLEILEKHVKLSA